MTNPLSRSFSRLLTMTLLPAALVLTTVACGDDDDDDDDVAAGMGGTSSGGTSSGGTSAGGAGSGGTSAGGTSAGTAGTTSGTSGSGGTAGSAGATQAQSDSQLAGILAVINMTEVTQGKLAETKGLRADVIDYGTMMDTMHTDNQSKLQTVLTSKGLTADENSAEVQMLKAKGDPATAKLTSDAAKTATFDDDYIQIQIDGHTDALTMLDTVLIPKAQDADLKAHFTTTRGDVVMHLDHAKMLKSGTGGMGGMSGAGGSTAGGSGGTTAAGAGGTTAAGAGGSTTGGSAGSL